MDYVIMFLLVLFSPVLILLVIGFWMAFGHIVDRILSKPEPPYCDIDPRCHPAFVWLEDGTGWIGRIKVIGPPSD